MHKNPNEVGTNLAVIDNAQNDNDFLIFLDNIGIRYPQIVGVFWWCLRKLKSKIGSHFRRNISEQRVRVSWTLTCNEKVTSLIRHYTENNLRGTGALFVPELSLLSLLLSPRAIP